ncbi:MAG: plasmid pRiA4b ORF-3 family protein [Desulfobulbaceae bacterium]|nr:plasmid pRiA4b ORF-3 family protein [Desulfobulbaceae bacterium]
MPAHEGRWAYPVCTGAKRACPPEDCGGPFRFMALREHYSIFHIMERLLEIIEDGNAENLEEERDALDYWFQVDRFDRKAPTGCCRSAHVS